MFSLLQKPQIIIYGLFGILIIFAFLAASGVIPIFEKDTPPPIYGKLTMWGFENEDGWNKTISHFQKDFPAVSINYKYIEEEKYGTALLNALAAGTGPDIFMLKDSSVLNYLDKIDLLKTTGVKNALYSKDEFKKTFVEAALGLVTSKDEIIGLPVSFDTLGLFYDVDFFNSENIPNPPENWDEFIDIAVRMTKISSFNEVERPGAAIGGTTNIDHFDDIVSLLVFQAGGKITDTVKNEGALRNVVETVTDGKKEQSAPAEDALSFYASFADPKKKNYLWSRTLPNSMSLFVREKTPMVFGYASDIPKIKERNPHLNFATAKTPQRAGSKAKTSLGRLDVLAVSKLSQNKEAAWKSIIAIASSNETSRVYLSFFGKPPALKGLVVPTLETPELLRPFYSQSLAAKTWLKPDEERAKEIFVDMVESVIERKSTVNAALGRADDQLTKLLTK